MPLANTVELLAKARRGGYGVFSIVAGDLEMSLGALEAVEALRAPLILVFNEGLTGRVPIEVGIPACVAAARRATVPVVVALLEQAGRFEPVSRALRAGASCIMFAADEHGEAELVPRTRQVVTLAHAVGASVEGRLGQVGRAAAGAAEGRPGDSGMTDPGLAAAFVRETGVDALAISFGNAYGGGRAATHDLDRVRRIREAADVPLVMHGGSGLDEAQYRQLVAAGITWFCCYSSVARAVTESVRGLLAQKGPGQVQYHDLIVRAVDGFRDEARSLVRMLGCGGQA